MEDSTAILNGSILREYIDYNHPENSWMTGAPAQRMARQFTHAGFDDGNGIDATTGTFYKNIYERPKGFARYVWPGSAEMNYRGDLFDLVGTAHNDPGIWTSDNTAYNKLLSNLYDKMNAGMNGTTSVSIGEFVKGGGASGLVSRVASALRDPIKAVEGATEDFAKAMSKVAKMTPKSAAKHANNAYLNYRYGLGPAVDDVNRVLEDETPKLGQIIVVSARSSAHKDSSTGFNSQLIFQDVPCYVHTWNDLRYEAQVEFYICSPNLNNLARLVSFNPLVYAWELTRLSFVADWMVDVSSYLQNLESSLGLGKQFVRGYLTVTSNNRSRTLLNKGWDNQLVHVQWSTRRSYKQRERLYSFPSPSYPSIKAPFKPGSERLLNAASLLAGVTHLFGR